MLDRVRFVLVSPGGSANVGAVCRAMANMGLAELVIVAPRCDPRDETAFAYATHGRWVLERAHVVADIPDAIEDCVRTYATSSKLGLYRRQAAITPETAAREAFTLSHAGPVAFVFGPENYGLRTQELLHFDRLITISTDEACPVMNLAAAATVVAYELRRAWLERTERSPLPMAIDGGAAFDAQKAVMFRKLFDALDAIRFFDGQSPDHLRHALRQLLGRVDLTVNEADILIGMARQIRWWVDHHPDRVDPGP